MTYLWENLSSGAALGTGSSVTLSPGIVSPTDVVQCTITATDVDGEVATSTDSVQISNSAPVLGSVSIQPANGVTTSSSISCSATVSDPDGEQLSPTYSWSNLDTGLVLGSGGSLVLDPTLAQPGDSIQCTATVSDAYGASDSTAVSVMVENTAPVSAGVA